MGIRVVGGIIGNRRDEVRVGGIVDLIHIRITSYRRVREASAMCLDGRVGCRDGSEQCQASTDYPAHTEAYIG